MSTSSPIRPPSTMATSGKMTLRVTRAFVEPDDEHHQSDAGEQRGAHPLGEPAAEHHTHAGTGQHGGRVHERAQTAQGPTVP